MSSLLSTPQIEVGATIPALEVKENAPDATTPLVLKGKNVIVRKLPIDPPISSLTTPR